jgi:hypothetical protein
MSPIELPLYPANLSYKQWLCSPSQGLSRRRLGCHSDRDPNFGPDIVEKKLWPVIYPITTPSSIIPVLLYAPSIHEKKQAHPENIEINSRLLEGRRQVENENSYNRLNRRF